MRECVCVCVFVLLTILWGQLVVGVLIDVVPADSDADAIQEGPVPLHVPLVCVDETLEDLPSTHTQEILLLCSHVTVIPLTEFIQRVCMIPM